MKTIEISGIKLHRVGTENDPGARAVVEVEVGGRWVEVLSEVMGANFCSTANAGAIAARAGIVAKNNRDYRDQVCAKCGIRCGDNKSKYCGDGSDKDNPHQWKYPVTAAAESGAKSGSS